MDLILSTILKGSIGLAIKFILVNPILFFVVINTVAIGFICYYIFFYKSDHRFCKEHFIIKEQMKKSVESVEEVGDDIESIYSKLRLKTNPDITNLLEDKEYQRFVVLTKILKAKLIKLLRFFFHENHLTLMTEPEFTIYIEDRSTGIIRKLKKYYNSWYISGGNPNIEDFYKEYISSPKGSSKLKDIIKEIFREGREISRQFEDKKYVKKYFKKM